MFNLFKSKLSSYLGIDVGTNSIKLVELENVGGRPRLVTYGIVEIESGIARSDGSESKAEDDQKIVDAISELIKKSGANAKQAVSALPNFSVFSSVISLPKISEKKIDEAVQWEAKKFVPMPIENVVLDWKIIEEEDSSGQSDQEGAGGNKDADNDGKKPEKINKNLAKCDKVLRVLLTAAPRHLVDKYVNIFKGAGLRLLSLETESFALSRSLVGNEDSAILIADIGSLTTDVTVVKKSVPIFSRSINVGGKTITQAIANRMGISAERAEQFKKDVGLGSPHQSGGSSSGAQAQPAAAGGKEGVSQIIENTFSSVVNEVKYTLDLQKNQSNPVEKVLITGGSSFLPSIDQYLANQLRVKVFIANPWARVSHPRELTEVLNEYSSRMGVSVGLAMREIE